VILHVKGPNLQAREAAATYEAAIDLVVDKLERQLEKHKGKHNRHENARRLASHGTVQPQPPVPVEAIERALRAENGEADSSGATD
jgi:hypothetical protein